MQYKVNSLVAAIGNMVVTYQCGSDEVKEITYNPMENAYSVHYENGTITLVHSTQFYVKIQPFVEEVENVS